MPINDHDTPLVHPATMQRYVEQLGRIGAQPNGALIRTQYDPAWVEARRHLAIWFAEAGLEVRHDAVGNLFGRLAGTDAAGTVLTGSHLDTVVQGGMYDGALGILAGLAALAALRQRYGHPRRHLEVVALCEEENSRFIGNYFGSRAILGLVEDDEPEHLHDADGTSLADAMRSIRLDPSRIAEARRDDIDAFIELHIEQGRVLQDRDFQLGIVSAIAGLTWQQFTVTGRADHAGTTPMTMRHDALQGAAAMATAVQSLTRQAGPPAVATVGSWNVHPGGANVVSDQVEFTLDLRHPNDDRRARLITEIYSTCAEIACNAGLELQASTLWDERAAPMDRSHQDVLAEVTAAAGYTFHELPSGAGHDSQVMSRHVPTAMLFVPSLDGRSHTVEEYSSPGDCARGADALARALYQLAY